MPSEVLHVCASSPRRITEDPGGSSPTFPTCWLDCRQAGRLCSSRIHAWCTKVRFQCPAAVRFRTSRQKKPCQLQLRHQQQHSWAVFFGCAVFYDWVCDVIPAALRDGSIVTAPVAHTQPAPPVSFSLSPRFSSLAGSKHEYYVAWLTGGLTRFSLREVADSSQVSKYLDNPVPAEFPGPSRTSLGVSCRVSKLATSTLLQSSVSSPGQAHPARVSPGAIIAAMPSLKSIARTPMKKRVIALTGRSRTPRRSQTPLASGQRGDGHGSVRSLCSLPGESSWTNDSCESPLCKVPCPLFPFFSPGCF